MQRMSWLAVLPLIVSTSLLGAPEHPTKAQAREQAKSLGSALKGHLQRAIQQGGLKAGVTECHLEAIPITHSLNKDGWSVGRTALRLRNPDNAPDNWEKQQLEYFNAMLKQQRTGPLEATSWNAETGEYRYMKAIVTQPVCTGCHGETVSEEVNAVIREYYPNDQATGFAPGSIRGAFTFTWRSETSR